MGVGALATDWEPPSILFLAQIHYLVPDVHRILLLTPSSSTHFLDVGHEYSPCFLNQACHSHLHRATNATHTCAIAPLCPAPKIAFAHNRLYPATTLLAPGATQPPGYTSHHCSLHLDLLNHQCPSRYRATYNYYLHSILQPLK
ncbi:hypothetical protein VNO80_06442 [Phaseolus coccineus]|uniref:Uncharacterized protein n=1 Tax=Phaseolus coccineus TaxID=3886 RepID=A0AAN9NHR0_PHACN